MAKYVVAIDSAVMGGSSGVSSKFVCGDFPNKFWPFALCADDDLLDDAGDGRVGVTAPAFLREFIEALRKSVGDAARVSRLVALGLLRNGLWLRLSFVDGAFGTLEFLRGVEMRGEGGSAVAEAVLKENCLID